LTKSDNNHSVSFWKTLAEMAEKGLQNLTYSEIFFDFISILASLSPRAYNLFRQNLAGRTIQNIRLQRSCSEYALHDISLCYKNVVQLGYSSLLGCIVGSTLPALQTRVQSHNNIYTIIDKIKSKNAIASQVRILLVIAYRNFYPTYLFVPWMYSSEGCEHFFGLAHQLLSDFLFNNLITLVPKISYLYKAYTSESISVFKKKTSATGYFSHYQDDNIYKHIDNLQQWPTNEEIKA
ncbi:13705_t:CDS:2, partial [Cetraspora pellucida]